MSDTLVIPPSAGGSLESRLRDLELSVSSLSAGLQRTLSGTWTKQVVTSLAISPTTSDLGGSLSIADRSIDGVKLALLAVGTSELADLSVTTAKLADASVTSAKLASGITVPDGSITDVKIADNAVTVAKILDGAVETLKLAALAVTEAKIAANAITTTKISDDAITTPKLVANSITTAKIAAGAVVTDSLAANAVTAAKIAALTITAGEIATNAITSTKILAGTIDVSHLAASWVYTKDLQISTAGKIRGGQTAFNTGVGFWLGDDSGTYKFSIGNPSTGFLTWNGTTLSISGSITVTGGNAVTSSTLSTSLSTKLDTGGAAADVNANATTIDGGKITALSVNTAQLAANAVTAAKITAGVIDVTHLASTWTYTKELIVGSAGKLRSGQTAYNTGTGFWLGDDSGTFKFSLGNASGNRLTWDGTTLSITGSITVSAISGLNYAAASSPGGAATSLAGQGALATQNSVTWTTQVTGAGKPEDNATVGAAWGSNLTGRPDELIDGRIATALTSAGMLQTWVKPATPVTTGAAGLYLGADYLGYYNGSAWRTYMDNAGRFYLGGTGGALQWDGTTLTISGYASSSALAGKLDVGGAAADVNANSTTISGAKITTGSITATQIASATITGDKIVANTITVDKLSVSTLSAIVADLGIVTAGTITIGSGNQNTQLTTGFLKQGYFNVTTAGPLADTTLSMTPSGNIRMEMVTLAASSVAFRGYDASNNLGFVIANTGSAQFTSLRFNTTLLDPNGNQVMSTRQPAISNGPTDAATDANTSPAISGNPLDPADRLDTENFFSDHATRLNNLGTKLNQVAAQLNLLLAASRAHGSIAT